MSAIRYNVLTDRAFLHGCYRTLAEYKGSGFLGNSAVCGGIFALQFLKLIINEASPYIFQNEHITNGVDPSKCFIL
jgi:hypothetical protein